MKPAKRKPGRPPEGRDMKTIALRVPVELFTFLKKESSTQGLQPGVYLRSILERSFLDGTIMDLAYPSKPKSKGKR